MSKYLWDIASRAVTLDAVTITVGDYPLSHILKLVADYGDTDEVVDRLQNDGWTPAEIVTGVARA